MIRTPEQMPKKPALEVLKRLPYHLDLFGFFLFAPSVIMLLLALQWGGSEYPWRSATIIGLFCGAFLEFFGWLAYNIWRGEEALVPLSTATKRVVWSSSLTGMFLMTTLFVVAYFLPIYFQAVLGASPVMSGVYMLPTIGPQLLGVISSGILGK